MGTALPAFAGVGIELEYAIVDARRSTCVRSPPSLARSDARARAGPAGVDWSNELVAHVVELKNARPVRDLAALPAAFTQRVVRGATRGSRQQGACLMPTGMHPWMDPAAETALWPGDGAAIYDAYDRLFDCRRHGWSNLQSMHVNLPFDGDDEFARLHAAIRVVLPIIPALAASSPFAEGRAAAALDQRLVEYRDNSIRFPSITGRVIPEDVDSRADVRPRRCSRRCTARSRRADPAGTLQHEWLNARGAIARFDRSAIEIRLCDAQECPRADLAIAALLVAVTRALYEARWSDVDAQRAISTDRLVALLERCVHEADLAIIDDAGFLALFGVPRAPCTAATLWHALIDRCGDEALTWNPDARAPLALLDAQGPLARRLVRAAGGNPSRAALRDIYRRLCDGLAADQLFEAPERRPMSDVPRAATSHERTRHERDAP